MADYETFPDSLSISSISYKELILSDIICKTVAFPPRRIFEAMETIFFSQLNPDITGKSNGDVVGGLSVNGGAEPIVYTLDTGIGDDDNGDFTISGSSVLWGITPTNTDRSIRINATDANGSEVEQVFALGSLTGDTFHITVQANSSVGTAQYLDAANYKITYLGGGFKYSPSEDYHIGIKNLENSDEQYFTGLGEPFGSVALAEVNIGVFNNFTISSAGTFHFYFSDSEYGDNSGSCDYKIEVV